MCSAGLKRPHRPESLVTEGSTGLTDSGQTEPGGTATMYPQPKQITRRTLLKGVGVTMALPWLESLPAFGEGATAAAPKRFAALFMGNGINPKHWWAKGT